MLRALIFDVDGTLAETEEAHRQAFNEIFAEEGVAADWPDPANDWSWDRALYTRLLETTGGKERIAAIHVKKTARFGEILAGGGLGLREGVKETVEAARARGVRLAIATTTSRPNVEAVCRAGFGAAASEVFEVIAAGDEVAKKKPAPGVYELALERLGLPAEACVALEDSRNGLDAALGAGLRCVVSPSLYTAHQRFDGAAAVINPLCFDALAALNVAAAD